MVGGLEYRESTFRGRPSDRFDGSESDYEGIEESEYWSEAAIDAFSEIFGEADVLESDHEIMADGGVVPTEADPRYEDGEPYTGSEEAVEGMPQAGFTTPVEETEPTEDYMGDFPM